MHPTSKQILKTVESHDSLYQQFLSVFMIFSLPSNVLFVHFAKGLISVVSSLDHKNYQYIATRVEGPQGLGPPYSTAGSGK